MVKISDPQFNVGIANTPIQYVNAQGPNLQPIANGLTSIAQSFLKVEAEQKRKADDMLRFKTIQSLGEFETQSKLNAQKIVDSSAPDDTTIAQKVIDSQINYEKEFLKTVPPELQPEFAMRAESVRGGITLNAHDQQDKLNTTFYKNGIAESQNQAKIDLADNPDNLEKWKADLDTKIDASGLTDAEKFFLKKDNARLLETAGYAATVKRNKLTAAQYSGDVAESAVSVAKNIGMNPVDLLTIISFETGGTFSTTAKNEAGTHIGFIQFGPEEQKTYGIHPGMSVGEQMSAVGAYLVDRGYRPGMSMYDIYSIVNAGSPGHYNASDAHNGGTPGTVRDKVDTQMAAHRAKAEALLGGKFEVPDTTDADPRFANVLYEDRVAAQNDADTEVKRAMAALAAEKKAAQDTYLNDLYIGLSEGRYGQKELEAGIEAGKLNDYEDRKKAYDIIEKQKKDAETGLAFATRLARGDVLDYTDNDNKKGMNLWFNQDNGEAKLQKMDQRYVTDTLAQTFAKTGMLPPDAIGILGALSRSADGRQVMFALESLNLIKQQNPSAYHQVPEELRKKADSYDTLRYTLPDNKLVEAVTDSPSIETQRAREALAANARKQLDDPNGKIQFKSVLDTFGATQAEAGTKAYVMENEWKNLVVYYAEKGVPLDVANTKATEELQRKWGTSEFDGQKTLMRNPPEKFYRQIGKSHEWITKQARGELGLMPDEQVQLVSDDRTEADLAAGRPPSYIPMVNRIGVWEPVTIGPIRTPTSATAMHDVGQVKGKDMIQRIYFRPTQEDLKVAEHDTLVQNLQARIAEIDKNVPPGEMGKILHPVKAAERQVLQNQLDAATKMYDDTKNTADKQYMTPAQQQLVEAQKQFAPLNAEMQSWTDPIEQWPKAKQWEALYDQIEMLKTQVRNEVGAKRATQGTNDAAN